MNKPLFFSVPAVWIGTFVSVLIIGVVDFSLGYEFSSFLFYFIPIAVTGWFAGLLPSVLFSIISAIIWFASDTLSGHPYTHTIAPLWNMIIRFLAFLFVGWTMTKVSTRLHRSEAEVKVLEGLLPICARCKRIRDENGHWHHLEEYIEQHSKTKFTHAYCSECGNRLLAEAGLSDRLPESKYAGDRK